MAEVAMFPVENEHPTRTRVLSPGESHLRRERHGHQKLRGVKESSFRRL